MKKELGVGIVGLGWVAGAHINAMNAVNGANVTAICSRREHNVDELEAQFGIRPRVYQDLSDMLNDPDVDIVDICTPHPFHKDQAIAAAEAGKNLIIEKPLAINWDDAQAIRNAVQTAGVQACVCFECRFSAHFRMIRSVIDQGLLGEIHYAEVDYYHGIGPWYGQFDWNVKKDIGGSSLLTAGCHALDAMLMFMDGAVEEVTSYHTSSSSDTFKPYEYPTTSVSIVKFDDGHIGKVTSCIDCLQPYYFHIHLVGSEGSLLDNRFTSRKLDGLKSNQWSTLETSLIDSGSVDDHPYEPQFQAFINALQQNQQMPQTDIETAFESHRVAFAADCSANENRTVKLSSYR